MRSMPSSPKRAELPSVITFDALISAFEVASSRMYGEDPVTELEHALQCADLAYSRNGDKELALAGLLHDIGRFAVPQSILYDTKDPEFLKSSRPATGRGHQDVGADIVATFAPARTAWCVRAHADAKRYLCTVEPEYRLKLNDAARRTMILQGGLMAEDELKAFESHRWHKDAVELRRCDDAAKVPGAATRSLSYWLETIRPYLDAAGQA